MAAVPTPPPSASASTSKYAWSTYQTAPLPSEVPRPSSRMLENARHSALLRPAPPADHHNNNNNKQASESLMKMLNIG